LTDYGVTTEYIGILFPAGFTFEKIEVREYSDVVKFSVTYAHEDDEINFTIWHYLDSTSLELNAAEKMPPDAEIYTYEDTIFYLIENTENTTISWVEGVEKYSLWGAISKAQAMQMIDSIYEGLS